MHTTPGPVCCRCLDISPSGMSVVSPRAVRSRQRVRIESSFKGQRLVLEAVVIRCTRTRSGHVLGVRFEGLEPRVRAQLADVLRSMQVQAALAMQSVAFLERLPVLQLPEPEAEPRTERSPVTDGAPAPAPMAVAPIAEPPIAAPSSPGPAQTGATLLPYAVPPSADEEPDAAAPSPGPAQTGVTLLPWDSTIIVPPSPNVALRAARNAAASEPSGGSRHVGLEEGWTEEELVTSHYRPAEPSDPEVGARTSPRVDDALAELDLDDPPRPAKLDRTLLTPQPSALASFASSSVEDDRAWLGPARTGKTMVVHVQDLIAAYAPPIEPELDLPEPTAPITAPATMPRLSDELQAALDRLRRREDAGRGSPAKSESTVKAENPENPENAERTVKAERPENAEASGAGEPAPRPSKGTHRRRRPSTTQVYATTGRDDTQVRALYHAALANLGDTERGDGS